jgi:hypothetical protein
MIRATGLPVRFGQPLTGTRDLTRSRLDGAPVSGMPGTFHLEGDECTPRLPMTSVERLVVGHQPTRITTLPIFCPVSTYR